MWARSIIGLCALIACLALPATSAAAVSATYTGSVSATGVDWQFRTLSVTGSGPLTETLTWSTSTAKLLVGLSHKNSDGSWTWVAGSQGAQPVTLTWQVTPGTWRLAVEALSGASSYRLDVTYPDATPSTKPPEVTLIFSRTELPTIRLAVRQAPAPATIATSRHLTRWLRPMLLPTIHTSTWWAASKPDLRATPPAIGVRMAANPTDLPGPTSPR